MILKENKFQSVLILTLIDVDISDQFYVAQILNDILLWSSVL